MQWNPTDYSGINRITVSFRDVWVPELTLSSPVEKLNPIGKTWDRIRVYDSQVIVSTQRAELQVSRY